MESNVHTKKNTVNTFELNETPLHVKKKNKQKGLGNCFANNKQHSTNASVNDITLRANKPLSADTGAEHNRNQNIEENHSLQCD